MIALLLKIAFWYLIIVYALLPLLSLVLMGIGCLVYFIVNLFKKDE